MGYFLFMLNPFLLNFKIFRFCHLYLRKTRGKVATIWIIISALIPPLGTPRSLNLPGTLKQPAFLASLGLLFGILSISFSALFIRWAHAPGVISSFYRMGIGAIIMVLPFTYQVRRHSGYIPLRGILWGVAGGFFFSLDMYFWTTGIIMSGATIPTLMANTAPLWVGLGSWLVFREKQRSRFWVGLVIAMFGASFVLGQDLLRSSEFGLGALFGIFSAVFYGGYLLASQRGRSYLNTLSYFWISTLVSAICLLIYSLVLHQPLLDYDKLTWLLFLVMGIVVQVLGWMSINYAQGHIPAAIISPTMLAQPLITAVLAGLFLNETFTPWHLLGGVMVILGVYLVHRSRYVTKVDSSRLQLKVPGD
jgi:drug/metabolite transporter (DMT)-like permease